MNRRNEIAKIKAENNRVTLHWRNGEYDVSVKGAVCLLAILRDAGWPEDDQPDTSCKALWAKASAIAYYTDDIEDARTQAQYNQRWAGVLFQEAKAHGGFAQRIAEGFEAVGE